MTTRWEVEKAVCWSELAPPARHIILALLTKADNNTAVVKPEHAPSLSVLAAMTGLSRSSVLDWLNALEDAGWVKRHRRQKGNRAERTSYTLLIGSPTAKKRARSASASGSDAPEAGSPPSGLGHHAAYPGRPSDGLGQEAAYPDRPPGGLGVGRQLDSGRPPGGPATTRRTTYQNPSLTAAVVDAPSAPAEVRREEGSSKDGPQDLPHRLMAERGRTGDRADRIIAAINADTPKGPGWWRKVAANGDLDDIIAAAEADEPEYDPPRHLRPVHPFQSDDGGLNCTHPGCGMWQPHANHKVPA